MPGGGFLSSIFFFIITFQKKSKDYCTFNHSYSEKSLNRAQICYYDPQSAGITVQSPQSTD